MLDNLLDKFFSEQISSKEASNISLSFQRDESLFKETFLNKIPDRFDYLEINTTHENFKKIKDFDATFILKSFYYRNMIKRNIIETNNLNEDFYKLIISNKDFEKNFYLLIREMNTFEVFKAIKEISTRRESSFVNEFYNAINSCWYTHSPFIIETRIQALLNLLDNENLYTIHCKCVKNNNIKIYKQLDYYLASNQDYQNYFNKLLYSENCNFIDGLSNLDSSFDQYFNDSLIFEFCKNNEKLQSITLKLAKKYKNAKFIFWNASFFNKRKALGTIISMGDSEYEKVFINRYSNEEELKDLMIYS